MASRSQATDEDLVRRFRSGDTDALSALLERHGAALARHAERHLPPSLRPRVSVVDMVQEAGIVAHRRRADFEDRGDGSFRNWMLRIVELKVKEAIQAHAGAAKRAVAREVPRSGRPATAFFVSREPSPSQVAIGVELETVAREALLALPADYREVLRLAREQGLPLREVARCMGRSREAVKKLYGRALCRFTAEFERRGGKTRG